jgi:protein-disulfide isomerase
VTPFAKRLASGLAIAAALIASVKFGRTEFRAPVTDSQGRLLIIEFSDYECPHCRAAQSVIKSLLEHYEGKVHWVHRHFPLDMIHKWAHPASVAAVCAEQQGKFEAYNALLFDRQDVWPQAEDPRKLFYAYANEIGLDMKKFEACVLLPEAEARVNADKKEGQQLGVHSTPTFFIDNERMVGGGQLSTKGTRIIDRWLAKK